MRRTWAWVLFVTIGVLVTGGVSMVVTTPAVETLNLTTPIAPPSTTTWKVDEIHLRWGAQRVDVRYLGSNGEEKRCAETGAAAVTTMTTLNKANLTSNSLHKRAMTWGQALAGCLGAGTVSGTPD